MRYPIAQPLTEGLEVTAVQDGVWPPEREGLGGRAADTVVIGAHDVSLNPFYLYTLAYLDVPYALSRRTSKLILLLVLTE